MRILIFTQAVDINDPILGFFCRWLTELAAKFEYIEVVCLKEGQHNLPANVRVHSLGKEGGRSRIKYIFNFYRYIFSLSYSAVFVHMNEEYVLLGGWWWRLCGKKIILWRNFKTGSWMTPLACRLANRVCYTSPESYTKRFANSVQMPVGIDTAFFAPSSTPPTANTLLFLGRLDAIKNVSEFVGALRLVRAPFVADIYGNPSEGSEQYAAEVKKEAAAVPSLSMHGEVTNTQAKELYQSHAIYVNLTPSGSFDKTIIEAAAAGCLVVCSNEALRGILPNELIVAPTAQAAAKGIEAALAMSPQERINLIQTCRAYVEREHSLTLLAQKFTDIFIPRRVAFLINSLEIGGAESVFVRDANTFAQRGYQVLFLALYDRDMPLQSRLDKRIKFELISSKGIFDFAAAWRISRLLKSLGVQTLISTLNDSNIMARWAVLTSGFSIKLFMREANDLSHKTLLQRILDLIFDSLATKIIAVSQQVRRGMFKSAPWRESKIALLYNGVEVPLHTQRKLHHPARIVMVGSLTVQKDHPTLIAALLELQDKGIAFEVRVVGGWDAEPLKRQAVSLGEKINFTGALSSEQVKKEYQYADIFVLSSQWEGCPNVVLEAMSHGLPVVATSVGGVPELVEDGVTGLLVAPKSPHSLAEALARVVGDEALWNTLGEAGYRRAQKMFSNEEHFARLEALIK